MTDHAPHQPHQIVINLDATVAFVRRWWIGGAFLVVAVIAVQGFITLDANTRAANSARATGPALTTGADFNPVAVPAKASYEVLPYDSPEVVAASNAVTDMLNAYDSSTIVMFTADRWQKCAGYTANGWIDKIRGVSKSQLLTGSEDSFSGQIDRRKICTYQNYIFVPVTTETNVTKSYHKMWFRLTRIGGMYKVVDHYPDVPPDDPSTIRN